MTSTRASATTRRAPWSRRSGQEVKAGELLVELDSRSAPAELKLRQAALAVAREQLRRLKMQPRPEEVPVSEAQVRAAEATVRQTQDLLERARKMIQSRAVSEQEHVAA